MSSDQGRKRAHRIAVFGLGRFGAGLAVRLSELGADVLAVDSENDIVEQIDPQVSRAICLDATSEFAMRKLNAADIDLAIVCIGRNISAGLLVTAVLQRIGVHQIWVRAIDQNQAEILQSMGVTRIISLENEMARQVAQQIMMPDTQIIAPITTGHSLAEVHPRPEWVGKTLLDLNFRNTYGLNIIAIKSREVSRGPSGPEKVEMHVNDLPHADDVIKEGDVLVVVGSDEKISELQADM